LETPILEQALFRHNFDDIHIKKNIFEQMINIVMNMKVKTKDDINARKDMATHCKRRRLDV